MPRIASSVKKAFEVLKNSEKAANASSVNKALEV